MKLSFWLLLVVGLLLLYSILAIPYYSGDVKNHLTWANSILTDGPLGFYNRRFVNFFDPNYPPLAMWGFTGSLWLYRWLGEVINGLNQLVPVFPSGLVHWWQWENVQMAMLKLPAILASVGVSLIGGSLAKNLVTKRWIWGIVLIGLSPAVIYISALWGQIDVLPLFWLLLAIKLLFDKKFFWSGVSIGLALMSKQSVIVLVVPLGFVFWQQRWVKEFGLWMVGLGVISYLLYWPFVGWSPLAMIQQYLSNFVNVPPVAADNALNLWGVITNFRQVSDQLLFMGISWEWWGRISFLLLAIGPLIWLSKNKVTVKTVLLTLNCITLLYFFSLTRMHERYLIPAVIFESLLVLVDRRFGGILLFVTVFHLVNLYMGMHQPNLDWIEQIIGLPPVLTGLVIMYAGVMSYNWWLTYKLVNQPGGYEK